MKGEKGFTLIEVLVALAVLGVIGAAFLGSLATSSNVIFIVDEKATAESLARSQMEYTKKQDYDATNNPPQYEIDPDLDIPAGYEINVTAERLDPNGNGTENDDGIQKITITVDHLEKQQVIVLEDYKVNR